MLKEYLDKYCNSEASPVKLKRKLLAAMKDYVHYAQIALEANNNWTLGVDHVAMDCANEYTDKDLEEARQSVSSYKQQLQNSQQHRRLRNQNCGIHSSPRL